MTETQEMTEVELLTYNRYYKLIESENPNMLAPEIVAKAKTQTAIWMSRRDDGYMERANTKYDLWSNV